MNSLSAADDAPSTEMRKFLLKYAEFHPRKEDLRMAFVKFKSPEELERIFRTYYENAGEG